VASPARGASRNDDGIHAGLTKPGTMFPSKRCANVWSCPAAREHKDPVDSLQAGGRRRRFARGGMQDERVYG
jgi:hypothetical protein